MSEIFIIKHVIVSVPMTSTIFFEQTKMRYINNKNVAPSAQDGLKRNNERYNKVQVIKRPKLTYTQTR